MDARRFIEVFGVAATQAGAVARRLQGRVQEERKKTTSRTPEAEALSAVDLAAQDVILRLLHHEWTDVAIDAEEETDTALLFPPESTARSLVVLDPIDGTLNYLRGSRDYAVMGALVEQGRYRAAVVYFPADEHLYWAIHNEGCWVRQDGGAPRRVHVGALPHRVLFSPKAPRPWRDKLQQQGWGVHVSRCSAVDASAPALGRASGAIARGPPDRRRAIGFLLTVEAGGVVQLGEHPWHGEDPEGLPGHFRPTITAGSAELAAWLVHTVEERSPPSRD